MQRRAKINQTQLGGPGEPVSGFFVSSGLDADGPPTQPMPERLAAMNRILVVARPGLAVGEMVSWLRGFGHPVDFADGADAGWRQVSLTRYRFVVMVENDLGEQAAALMRAIHRSQAGPTRPRLLVVAQRRSLFARLVAWRAGCDKYLVVPLSRRDVRNYLEFFSNPTAD